MSFNKIIIYIVIVGYLFVNVGMQREFFSGRDIWAKYSVTDTAEAKVKVGQKAYYAKSAFLLILLVLLVLNVPFPLGFGISFMAYAVMMLIFFGVKLPTVLYSVASLAVLGSYFVPARLGRRGDKGA